MSRVRRVRSILNGNHPWGQLYIKVRRVSSVRSVIYCVGLNMQLSFTLVSRVRRVRSIFREKFSWTQLHIMVRRVSSVRSLITECNQII